MITGELEVKPQAFAAAVRWAARFVGNRPVVPMQGAIMLTPLAGSLLVDVFSEHVTARAIVPYIGEASGVAAVSGRLLAELVATFPDKPVTITGTESGIGITAGRWDGSLPGMDDATFPALPTPPPAIGTVQGDALAEAITRVGVAATDDEKKPIAYRCIHLGFAEGSIVVTATDGLRLARTEVLMEGGEARPVLVLASVMTEVAKSFAGPDVVRIGADSNALALTSQTRAIVLRQVIPAEGAEFPAATCDQILAVQPPYIVTLKVSDLIGPTGAMKRAVLMRDKDSPVVIELEDGNLRIAALASDTKGRAGEDVDVVYAGPQHRMGANPEYLTDALTSAPGATVEIRINDKETRPGRPAHAVVTVPGNDRWRHVLMPIKLRG
jgi:DNA polymerase-3 subunit beta